MMPEHVKNHLNENIIWLGIHIHKNTTCFPTNVQYENVSRSKPLLLEWEVTSTHITSGHNMNNQRADSVVQAMAINKISVGGKLCSQRSTCANGSWS